MLKSSLVRKWLLKGDYESKLGVAISEHTEHIHYCNIDEDCKFTLTHIHYKYNDQYIVTPEYSDPVDRGYILSHQRYKDMLNSIESLNGIKPLQLQCFEYIIEWHKCLLTLVDCDTDAALKYAVIEFDNITDCQNFKLPDYLDWQEAHFDEYDLLKNHWNRTRLCKK